MESAGSIQRAGNESRYIGEYRVIASLGTGGMARVFLAMSERGGFTKLLVLKVLRDELQDAEYVEMFQKEARLAARLNHPHVVQTYTVGEDGNRHFMAMEYLEGQPLSAILSRRRSRGGIPLPIAIRILCDSLDGLHYAHTLTDFDGTPLRIVHRDISPQNVFVTYTGQAKVLDFGIAKVSGSPLTETGVIKGKVRYMAPEQMRGRMLDGRADVFSVGVMLWETIAGRRFAESNLDDVAVLARRIEGQEPRIQSAVPGVPPELAYICDRALALDPNDRFGSAAEMRDALDGWLRRQGIDASSRSVAELVGAEFAEDRARLRSLVDEQIKRMDVTSNIIDIRPPSMLPSGSSQVDVVARATDGDVTALQPGLPGGTADRKSRALPWILAALLGVGVIAALLLFLFRSHLPGFTEPKPVAAPGSAVAAPRRVAVRLDATPVEAHFVLDGTPLDSNPYVGELPADDRQHELRVVADGYAPEVRKVSLAADLNVILQLRKTATEPSTSASVPVPPSDAHPADPHTARPVPRPVPPPVTAPVGSAPKPPNGKSLDWKDPWRN